MPLEDIGGIRESLRRQLAADQDREKQEWASQKARLRDLINSPPKHNDGQLKTIADGLRKLVSEYQRRLYAWHVWRFYPVAERHAFSTLEFALRLKLGRDKDDRPPGLTKLMDEAIERNILIDAENGH